VARSPPPRSFISRPLRSVSAVKAAPAPKSAPNALTSDPPANVDGRDPDHPLFLGDPDDEAGPDRLDGLQHVRALHVGRDLDQRELVGDDAALYVIQRRSPPRMAMVLAATARMSGAGSAVRSSHDAHWSRSRLTGCRLW
jgi:hypothetical protein